MLSVTLFNIFLVLAGFIAGSFVVLLFQFFWNRRSKAIAGSLIQEMEEERQKSLEAALSQMKESFSSLSFEALARSQEELIKQAKEQLGHSQSLADSKFDLKKDMIDEKVMRMHKEYDQISELIKQLEKDRSIQHGELTAALKNVNNETAALAMTANSLKEVLSNSQTRGQWGERIAEDILKMAGFIENINYVKQRSVKGGGRPDFTFLLPKEYTLNMDVKFPLENYTRYLQASNSQDSDQYKKTFLKDVKMRIKELTTREYISIDDHTVDLVLLFVPNEQIFAFIQAEAPELLDEGIKHKIVCCSPMTLFAVLAVVRQSVDNFAIEETSNEILGLMATFKKQWKAYLDRFDAMGKKLQEAQIEYEKLSSTRRRLLDKPVEKLDAIRQQRNISEAPLMIDDLIN